MSMDVLSALRVSATSAAWTLTASAAAILIGLADASLALVAFGAVQLFDFAADVVLVIHFRAARGAETRSISRGWCCESSARGSSRWGSPPSCSASRT